MREYKTKRARFEILRSQMDSERSSFISHWRDIGDYVLPRRPRFTLSETNRGERKNQKIIDSTASLAARTLRSGMMGGITSPARPWFRLTSEDPNIAEQGAVKEWLSIVADRMSNAFLRSNIYNALPIVYGDLGVFGTAAMLIDEDFTGDVIRAFPFPVGSYMIGNDDLGQVRVFSRDFRMTVRQLLMKFGTKDENGKWVWDNFSDHVKFAYQSGHTESWVDVCHIIEPNEDSQEGALEPKYKKFTSCYFERGTSGAGSGTYITSGKDDDRYLRESGYDYFPVLCPRWEVADGDVYGTDCPGMVALGDIKQLQLGEKRAAMAIEKMINPPMVGPNSLKNMKASILPGDITFSDEASGKGMFRPAHEINFRLDALEGKQAQVRERVRRAFFEDLFLMLANSDRRQITAREIEERHQEKLLALGPVLEQLNQVLLDPLIDITFDIMMKQGLIPEPPEEIQGNELKVEYVSFLAQAQKSLDVGGLERFASTVGQMAQSTQDPTVLDKIDADQWVDEYADRLGVPPSVVRPDDEVAGIRAQRAEAQQAQAMAAGAKEVTGAVKDLSETDMSKDSALKALIERANVGSLV